MIKVLISVVIVFIIYSFALAAEIYTWIGKDGSIVISNLPPPKGAKVIDVDSYTPSTPAEIRAFRQKEKIRENAIELNRSVNMPHYDQAEAERAYKEAERKTKINRAREDLQDAQDRRERYRDYHRGAHSQWGSNYWDEQVQYQDKEIEKKRRRLKDLEDKK